MTSPGTLRGIQVSGLIRKQWDDGHRQRQTSLTKRIHLEILTDKGSYMLIQLRTLSRNYHLRLGDKISLRVQAILPLYQVPSITDDALADTSARIGATAFPEKDAQAAFQVITKYNAIVPDEIINLYKELRQGTRPQMTWKLLIAQIELQKASTHLMYLSGILMKIKLVELWKEEQLYCMPCDCGNVVFANTLIHSCSACLSNAALELRPNPQIIGRIADETACMHEGHNLLVADRAWEALLGGPPVAVDEAWLQQREKRLRYERHTWVFLWLGKWGGGRLVLVDVVE